MDDKPVSLTAERAKRTNNAADWTPRDVIIEILEMIDKDEIKPEGLIVCFYEKATPQGITDVRYSNACPNIIMATGLLHRAIHLLGAPNG